MIGDRVTVTLRVTVTATIAVAIPVASIAKAQVLTTVNALGIRDHSDTSHHDRIFIQPSRLHREGWATTVGACTDRHAGSQGMHRQSGHAQTVGACTERQTVGACIDSSPMLLEYS